MTRLSPRSIVTRLLTLAAFAALVVALRLVVFGGNLTGDVGGRTDLEHAENDAASSELRGVVAVLIPDMTDLQPGESGMFDVKDTDGKVLGHVLDTTGMPDTLTGYSGKVPVAIVFSPEGTVMAIGTLRNTETPSYIEHVLKQGLVDRFKGMTPEQALNARVDAISGATMSSEAILSSVKKGMAAVQGVEWGHQTPDHGEVLARLGAILVLIGGLAFMAAPRRLRRFRPLLLVADVVILGIVGGTTLSLAQFASWIANGPTLPRGIVPFLAFVIAAGVPLLTGRQVWCNCMCPFGAASELIAMIPLKKFRPGSLFRKLARMTGLIYLCIIVGLLVVWPNLDLASFEPFAAFSLAAAPVASIVIFAFFTLLSLACPRFWCRFLCPTGRILDTFARAGRSTRKTTDRPLETSSENAASL